MIELIKYFRILFLSRNISRERLKAFTEAHILSLAAHNPGGIFTTILNDVTTAYNNYYGDFSSEAVNLAVQESRTIAMNESRMALEKNLSDNEKLVAYTYRDDRPKYELFYPQGLTEYQNADLSTLATISDRYRTVLNDNAADFTPAFVTAYNNAQSAFVNDREDQQTAMSNVAGERSDLTSTRPQLAQQLTINLLTISLKYLGDESKCAVYFDQSILNAAFKESERKMSGEIDPGQTQSTFDNVTKAELMITAKNEGEEVLYYGFKDTDTEPATITDRQLNPGQTIAVTAAELGWTSTRKYLNFTNLGSVAGSYTVNK